MRRDAVAPIAELARSGRAQPAAERFRRLVHSGVRLHQLRHDRETFRVVQNFLTAELMWAGNNYGWDRWTTPTFGEETRNR